MALKIFGEHTHLSVATANKGQGEKDGDISTFKNLLSEVEDRINQKNLCEMIVCPILCYSQITLHLVTSSHRYPYVYNADALQVIHELAYILYTNYLSVKFLP